MYDYRNALHLFLQQNGIKQSYLARACGVPPERVSRLLHAKRRLQADELFDFCEALRITPEELAKRYEHPNA
ncbi:MAG: helix-turn-helix transcriptional regulator [Oscillospiraceae bacterium]